MALVDFERLRDILWPPGTAAAGETVYALLDGARNSRISLVLRRSYVDHCCLFAGLLPYKLAEVAPYLVTLGRDSRITAGLIQEGWGDSWGIFLTSQAVMQDLRRHFRRFFQVRDPSGRQRYFRYYDPRVLRVYLTTCTQEELRKVFGPVNRYLAEGDRPGSLVEFRNGPDGLERRIIDLDEPPATDHVESARGDGFPDAPDLVRPLRREPRSLEAVWRSGPLILRPEQTEALRAGGEARLVRVLCGWARRAWAEFCRDLGDEDLEVRIEGDVCLARSFGFETDRDIGRFINLALTLGPRFPDPRRHPWAFPILEDGTLSPAARIDALWAEIRRRHWPAGTGLGEGPDG